MHFLLYVACSIYVCVTLHSMKKNYSFLNCESEVVCALNLCESVLLCVHHKKKYSEISHNLNCFFFFFKHFLIIMKLSIDAYVVSYVNFGSISSFINVWMKLWFHVFCYFIFSFYNALFLKYCLTVEFVYHRLLLI